MSQDLNSLPTSKSSEWYCEATFPSIYGVASEFIESALNVMTDREWSQADIFAVNMALEESVTNAIEHGNKEDSSKSFFICCRITDDLVYISVRDEGDGFLESSIPDPREAENMDCPSGRGILLIHGFMTRVWYNHAGNQIYMEKVRTS